MIENQKNFKTKEQQGSQPKVKKRGPKLLTQEQMNLISEALKNDNSQLITQRLWALLQPTLGISKLSYARRKTLSGFLPKIGFSWEEYDSNKHPKKSWVQIRCVHCEKIYLMLATKMLQRRHKVQVCPKCYSGHYLYDEEWRRKNSLSQIIAQNKPETIEKHRNNSRLMWTGAQGQKMREAQRRTVSDPKYRENMARVMRNKWALDAVYRDRVNGKGVYKHVGSYEGVIIYHSKLELAFLLWCEDNKKSVSRCDISIPYIDPEDDKEHDYYPDFFVDDSIVEVKGQRWIDAAPATYRAKIDALAKYCSENKKSYSVVLDCDLKAYFQRANKYHEAQKQNSNTL